MTASRCQPRFNRGQALRSNAQMRSLYFIPDTLYFLYYDSTQTQENISLFDPSFPCRTYCLPCPPPAEFCNSTRFVLSSDPDHRLSSYISFPLFFNCFSFSQFYSRYLSRPFSGRLFSDETQRSDFTSFFHTSGWNFRRPGNSSCPNNEKSLIRTL